MYSIRMNNRLIYFQSLEQLNLKWSHVWKLNLALNQKKQHKNIFSFSAFSFHEDLFYLSWMWFNVFQCNSQIWPQNLVKEVGYETIKVYETIKKDKMCVVRIYHQYLYTKILFTFKRTSLLYVYFNFVVKDIC